MEVVYSKTISIWSHVGLQGGLLKENLVGKSIGKKAGKAHWSLLFYTDSGTKDENQMLHEWFELVMEKNKLMRYESELLIM